MEYSLALLVVLFGCYSTAPLPLSEQLRGSKPNIVIMFMDDTGWGDIGANWNVTVETKNIDTLAASGTRFYDFHAGASVCTPSRAALLTGRYGLRTGVTHNFGEAAAGGLPTNETILAEYLKSVGYKTKMIGKWHLGQSKPFHPSYRGFDEYLGLPYSNDMGCIDVKCYNKPPQRKCIPGRKRELGVPLYNCTTDCSGKANCSEVIIEQPVDLTTLDQRYGDSAVEWINRNKDNEFFLYIPFAHMHVPHTFEPRWNHTSPRGTIFGDTLMEVDNTVGRIIKALHDNGLEDNTLVVLTADNGPWNVKCEYGGLQGPFSGDWQKISGGGGATGKFTTWEGGHREAGIWAWPGKIPAGRVSNALASTLDIVPTVAKLAGVELHKDRVYDGLDIGPVLFDGSENGHQNLWHPDGRGALNVIRDGKYKAFYETYSAAECNPNTPEELLHDDGGTVSASNKKMHYPPLIFDLDNDPQEANPLPFNQEMVARFDKLRAGIMESINTTPHTKARYHSDWAKRGCCDPDRNACMCKGQNPPSHLAEMEQHFGSPQK